MKKILLLIVLVIGLMSCGNASGNSAGDVSAGNDRVEVIYFHGKQRCVTCMAIEKLTKEVIDSEFAGELKNGAVVYREVDISTPDGEKVADSYEVTWSSLFVNKWKNGKETRNDMTEFGFGNARKNPEGFKKGLADKISQSLK